jgi:bacillithiol biosynthesis cysteine-adding enzyme BshC
MPQAFSAFYAASGMKANAFLPRGFGDARDRKAGVAAAASRRVAPGILEVLRVQNEALGPSPARRDHLDALGQPGTVVVATGQQVGLFLGPLYTIYKAASAIVIARQLTAETGARCVPLFWLQTEDQDFAEIATCTVPVDDAPALKLQLREDPSRSRCSLADRVLGGELQTLINELEPALAGLPAAAEITQLLRDRYREGISPGHAFAGVLATLFADAGLLTFDPRCGAGAHAAAPILRSAIVDSVLIEAALTERGHALRSAGFDEQIELRSGSPLVFFHLVDGTGPRYRLLRTERGFDVSGAEESLAERELLAILERQPLRFSTSALLRPIVQDTLLPTAVYVGGPAEVSYFAQLEPLYRHFGLEPPLIAERAHFRLVPQPIRRILDKLGLSANDFDQPREALISKLVPEASRTEAPGPAWISELEQRLTGLESRPGLDPALTRAVERTRETVRHALERLAQRYQQVSLEQDRVLSGRLSRIEGWLRPEGHLQERVFSFPAFAARVGPAAFVRTIIDAIDPFSSQMREIDL